MKRKIWFLVISTIILSVPAFAQSISNDDSAAVRQVVDIYLAKKDLNAVRRTLSPDAKIISVDSARGRVVETLISKPTKKTEGTVVEPSQKIVAVDIAANGATVKVESEFAAGMPAPAKHFQYISLLKIGGDWKIVSILMPSMEFAQTAIK